MTEAASRFVSNGFSTHYSTVLDTTYTIEDAGGVRLMKFAAMPSRAPAHPP